MSRSLQSVAGSVRVAVAADRLRRHHAVRGLGWWAAYDLLVQEAPLVVEEVLERIEGKSQHAGLIVGVLHPVLVERISESTTTVGSRSGTPRPRASGQSFGAPAFRTVPTPMRQSG